MAATGSGEEDRARVSHLLRTVETHELLGPHLAMEELLLRLFHEERPRAYPWQRVEFGRTCSPERVARALAGYSAADIAGLTTEDGKVTADCQFCSAHHAFDPAMPGAQARLNLDGSRRG